MCLTNNLNLNISCQFTLTITKASNVGSYPRNFYSFTTVYSVGGVGTVTTSGVGHLDSTILASIILTITLILFNPLDKIKAFFKYGIDLLYFLLRNKPLPIELNSHKG